MVIMASIFGAKAPEKKEEVASKIPEKKVHVIVIGNEKGGCGKTTTTMHIMVALMRLGFRVGSIDIDSRQRSLSRYIENRRKTIEKTGVSLPLPQHIVITKSPFNVAEEAQEDERDRFSQAMRRVATCDFILVDSPGNDTYLSRLAHSYADTVITPINDSFVDLDVLATVDGETMKVIRPSIYSEMVWEQKLTRAKRDGRSMEWIVMRNRLSNLDARNKRFMKRATEELARRIGFRLAPGFSERVIYREMFLQGLTVLDVMDASNNSKVSISHVAARQEVRDLLKMLRIPEVDRRINEMRHNQPIKEEEVLAAEAAASVATSSNVEPLDVSANAKSNPQPSAPQASVASAPFENKPMPALATN